MKTFLQYFVYVILFIGSTLAMKAQTQEWQWAKSVGGTANETSHSVTTDSVGNVYMLGLFESLNIIVDTATHSNIGSKALFLTKYNSNGNILWSRSASNSRQVYAENMVVDKAGNLYVTGYYEGPSVTFGHITLTNSNPQQSGHMFLVKYNTEGSLLWAKQSIGGAFGQSIAIDMDNNIHILGYIAQKASFDNITLRDSTLGGDIFLAKYDSTGNVLWAKLKSSNNNLYGAVPSSIATDRNNNIYILGRFQGPYINFDNDILYNDTTDGSYDIFLAKYTINGEFIWAQSAGGIHSETGKKLIVDSIGNIYITGSFKSPFINFGSITLQNTNAEWSDTFLAKYDTDGNVSWAQSAGGIGFDEGNDIAMRKNGNIVMTGYFNKPSITFGDITLNNVNSDDIFIAEFDANGNVSWAESIGGMNTETSAAITIDPNNNIYITGWFNSSTMKFGSDVLNNNGNLDLFIAKLGHTKTSILEEIDTKINIFPNPTASQFHISNLKPGNWTITIYTLDGQPVFKKEITEADATIDLSGKAKGAYVYRLLKDGAVFKTGKLVLE
jgi:hypothetical protein